MNDSTLVLIGALIGAAAAIIGGIIGGFVQGWAWYRYEQKRAAVEKREQWIETALEWAANGGRESLRRANLSGADLSWTTLGSADLSSANLSGADLSSANLGRAILRGADLTGANLSSTDLHEADLRRSNLTGAKYNDNTSWPDGFDPVAAGAILFIESSETPQGQKLFW